MFGFGDDMFLFENILENDMFLFENIELLVSKLMAKLLQCILSHFRPPGGWHRIARVPISGAYFD